LIIHIVSPISQRSEVMAAGALEQVVTFTHQQLMDMALEKAKELIKEQTTKDPTGSSIIQFSHGQENESTSNPLKGGKTDYSCTVRFMCNGKR
jgi:hypothetical protein